MEKIIKLDWGRVGLIRQMHKDGKCTYGALVLMFGVTKETIKSIVRGETWPESKNPNRN